LSISLRATGVVVRQFIGCEVIDRNGGGDSHGGVFKLGGFAVADQALFTRLVDIVNARFIHSVAQWLRGNGKLESDLQTGKTAIVTGMEEIDGETISRRRGL